MVARAEMAARAASVSATPRLVTVLVTAAPLADVAGSRSGAAAAPGADGPTAL